MQKECRATINVKLKSAQPKPKAKGRPKAKAKAKVEDGKGGEKAGSEFTRLKGKRPFSIDLSFPLSWLWKRWQVEELNKRKKGNHEEVACVEVRLVSFCGKQAAEIYHARVTYLKVHLLLAKLASDEVLQHPQADPGPQLRTIVPKVHYFHHQLLECRDTQLNSRHTHCFTDEGGMRYVKNLARDRPSCFRRQHPQSREDEDSAYSKEGIVLEQRECPEIKTDPPESAGSESEMRK